MCIYIYIYTYIYIYVYIYMCVCIYIEREYHLRGEPYNPVCRRVEAAARIARAAEEELRELEMRKKQKERARREARSTARVTTERADTEAGGSTLSAAAVSIAVAARETFVTAVASDSARAEVVVAAPPSAREQAASLAKPSSAGSSSGCSQGELDLPELQSDVAKPQQTGAGSSDCSEEDMVKVAAPTSPGGVSYTSAVDDFDEESENLDEDVLLS